MKLQKTWKAITLSTFLFALAPTSAISDEEIELCTCEDVDNIVVIQNIGEEQYVAIHKLENDLLCEVFSSNRVDNRFRIDVAVCSRDKDT